MRKFLALFVTMGMLLSACGSKSDAQKVYNFGLETDIVTMDSAFATDPASMSALHATTEGLMGVDAKGKTVPMLAKSYSLNDDHTVYTFKLRDNLKWTDLSGKTYPLEAQDFVYSWQRALKNASEYAYMFTSDGASIKNADTIAKAGVNASQEQLDSLGIKAPDDKTVVVTLERPIAYFLDIMTFSCFYPQNQAYVEKMGKQYATNVNSMLSCGAFIATKWTKSNKMEFKKNANFFNAKDVELEKLNLFLKQNPSTAALNFKNGSLDYAAINSSLVDKYKKDKEYKQFQMGYVFYINVNHRKAALANKNVRAAISYAINRDDFTKNVLKDGSSKVGGMVGKTLAYNPKTGKDFRDDSGDYTHYDLTEAQQYLDEGLKELNKSSIDIEILYGSDESPEDTVAEYLQGALSKLKGLKVTNRATTRQGRIASQDAGQYDIALQHWGPDYADPTTYLNLGLSDNSNNRGKWNNAAFDEVMHQAQVETDASKRWDELLKAEKIMMEDYAFIPLFQRGAATLQRTNKPGLVYKMAVGSPYTYTYIKIK